MQPHVMVDDDVDGDDDDDVNDDMNNDMDNNAMCILVFFDKTQMNLI